MVIDGKAVCNVILGFLCDGEGDGPHWKIRIYDDFSVLLWSGSLYTNNPVGVYTRDGGDDASPSSVTIETGVGSSTSGDPVTC